MPTTEPRAASEAPIALVLACVALVAALAVGPGPALAAGPAASPWPMFQHDARHSGRSPYTGPSRLAMKWRAPVHGLPGSPAIGADGTIYVPTGSAYLDKDAGSLYAINPDGTQKWRFQFPLLGSCRQVAAYTAPAIADDGTIYVHTQAGYTPAGLSCTAGDSYLFAVNPNGTEKWHFAFNGGAAVFASSSALSSPTIGTDGTVYATSADTGLYAIDPAGTLDWAVSPVATSIYATPALGADGTIYVSIGDLHAYEPDGDPKWTADVGNGVPNESSPSVGSDGTIYACFLNPWACHAISAAGGDLWSTPIDAGPTTPAIAAGGTIHFATGVSDDDGRLAAVNPNGTEAWHRAFPYRPIDTPVIGGDGRLYTRVDVAFAPGQQGFADMLFTLNPDGSESDARVLPDAGAIGDVSGAIGSDGTLYLPDPKDLKDFFNPYDPADQGLAAYVQGSKLTVAVGGDGGGIVTGPGIDCGIYQHDDCTETYLDNTAVTLQAAPFFDDASFTGWSGSCSGTGACQLTMDTDKSVGASFDYALTDKATGAKKCKKKKKKKKKKRKKRKRKCRK